VKDLKTYSDYSSKLLRMTNLRFKCKFKGVLFLIIGAGVYAVAAVVAVEACALFHRVYHSRTYPYTAFAHGAFVHDLPHRHPPPVAE
jgi:hypothetical protein